MATSAAITSRLSLSARYDQLYGQRPYVTSFVTCFIKGALSDGTSQKLVEKKKKWNIRRAFSFSFFSAAWFGCGQHIVYNILFRRLFGECRSVLNIVKKVSLDTSVWGIGTCLPVYYAFENWALGGSPMAGLKLLREEWYEQVAAYMSIWPAFQFINFRYVPPNFRIAAIASASYGYLIILSFLSHRTLD